MVEIRTAERSELEHAVDCIVAAFITDPIARFAWPRPGDHLRHMPAATRAFAAASFEHEAACISTDFCGAAIWLPPGVDPDNEAIERVLRATAEPKHLDDLLATFEKLAEWHPEEPHWFLPLIGVEPHAQGRGLGAALMRHAVERCDRDGLIGYLESSNPRNITLYERHGFARMGEVQVGDGPVVTPMLRQPR